MKFVLFADYTNVFCSSENLQQTLETITSDQKKNINSKLELQVENIRIAMVNFAGQVNPRKSYHKQK